MCTPTGSRVTVGTEQLWPFLVALQAIPAVTSLAITPFMPETPRYLMIVKNDEAAAQKCTSSAASVCHRRLRYDMI